MCVCIDKLIRWRLISDAHTHTHTHPYSESYQIGLVSWAQGCASPHFPTVFTRLSSYLDWISDKVCKPPIHICLHKHTNIHQSTHTHTDHPCPNEPLSRRWCGGQCSLHWRNGKLHIYRYVYFSISMYVCMYFFPLIIDIHINTHTHIHRCRPLIYLISQLRKSFPCPLCADGGCLFLLGLGWEVQCVGGKLSIGGEGEQDEVAP